MSSEERPELHKTHTDKAQPRSEVPKTFEGELEKLRPRLKAFAMKLCANPTLADDLVQETLMKAWAHRTSIQPGTAMDAWVYTILRNTYYSHFRDQKKRREVSVNSSRDFDGSPDGMLANDAGNVFSPLQQESHMNLVDLKKAMTQLSPELRDALILVGASGFTYEEAARLYDCPEGTIKGRVHRARNILMKLLAVEPEALQEMKQKEEKMSQKEKHNVQIEKPFKLKKSIAALVLRISGFSPEEIASTLRISPQSVKVYISSEKNRIQKSMV